MEITSEMTLNDIRVAACFEILRIFSFANSNSGRDIRTRDHAFLDAS